MAQTFSLHKSREKLKKQRYDTDITEMPFNPYTKRRKDLYGFIDIVAMHPNDDVKGLDGFQACGEDAEAHVKKYLIGGVDKNGKPFGPNEHLPRWLKKGNRFFIWAWRLRGAKGKRKLYQMREIEFLLKDGQVIAQENPHVQET